MFTFVCEFYDDQHIKHRRNNDTEEYNNRNRLIDIFLDNENNYSKFKYFVHFMWTNYMICVTCETDIPTLLFQKKFLLANFWNIINLSLMIIKTFRLYNDCNDCNKLKINLYKKACIENFKYINRPLLVTIYILVNLSFFKVQSIEK